MRRILAAVLVAALVSTGCATTGTRRLENPGRSAAADPALLASFVKQLPIGSRVAVDLTTGRRTKGTLMKADEKSIVVQPRTRIPETPIEIPLANVAAVELEQGGGTGRAIGIGIAAGAGAALGVILILAAILSGID